MEFPEQKAPRTRRITVLAYGEGDGEKIFIRHLVKNYRRRHVAVASSSAGGGGPDYILQRAIDFRGSDIRDHQFVMLDTDKPWSDEMKELAQSAGFDLIGNHPCLEAFFLEILNVEIPKDAGSGRCKTLFLDQCRGGKFNEDECDRLFTKAVLKSARGRVLKLDNIIRILEGEPSAETEI